MKSRRRRISLRIRDEVLYRNEHTCCICRTREDVQIHHIDGNPKNNAVTNLAVVCLNCHSRVTGSRGLGKSYKPGEIRKYKRSWEQHVFSSRDVHRPQIKYRKELLSQIDFIICEILAINKNTARVQQLLNLLYELHLWRGNVEVDKKIVEGMRHLALMSGLASPEIAPLVAEKLWEICWHFVGPKEISMNRSDLRYVLDCLDALHDLAYFNSGFGHGLKATKKIASVAENFFEIGLWYSKHRIVDTVIKLYKKSIDNCYENGKLKFKYGKRALRLSARRAFKMLDEERPTWRHQKRQLQTLLAR